MGFLNAFIKWLISLFQPAPVSHETELPTSVYVPRDALPYIPDEPLPAPIPVPMPPTEEVLLWDTPAHAFHAFRVMCDRAGLTVAQKNIASACVYQESQFRNDVVCNNRLANGVIWSRDIGIFQVNTYFHIGSGKRYPSEAYVLEHPEAPAHWMIDTLRLTRRLQPWASYTSGAYQQWLSPSSPMWKLRT